MKRNLIFLMILSMCVFVVFALFRKSNLSQDYIVPPASPKSKTTQKHEVMFEGEKFDVAYVVIDDPKLISLYPNFDEKIDSASFRNDHECTNLISGGFYSKEDSPTGLFVYDGKRLVSIYKNVFLNGIFWSDSSGNVGIDDLAVSNEFRFALQTGPILMRGGVSEVLKIISDEPARRIAVAITRDRKVYFMSFYNPDSVYLGPNLSELPNILAKFSEKIGVEFANAINLDGGSASSFLTDEISLPEITHAGSFFCIK